MVLEMLSHRTPPACIPANILTVASLLSPVMDLVEELPGVKFVRECRDTLRYFTKTLAAHTVGTADKLIQFQSDGTSRRQASFDNGIVGLLNGSVYESVVLDGGILAPDQTAESIKVAVIHAFKEGGDLLDSWRAMTKKMFPRREDLLAMIPGSDSLSMVRFAQDGAMFSTDTCNTARKFRKELAEAVKEMARNAGMSEDDIQITEGDCWGHLRNVWFGAIVILLGKYLARVLGDDLEQISSILRVTTDVNALFRATEKYFGKTANYAKGKGNMWYHWLGTCHSTDYIFPFARACGGSRQDIATEAAVPVLMNLSPMLEFLLQQKSKTKSSNDSILESNLLIILQSTEMVAALRVLSILHIAITIPLRWLHSKTHELAAFKFGVAEHGDILGDLEEGFEKIVEDGSLMLDEDFMMNLFHDRTKHITPFQDYLKHIFEEGSSLAVASNASEDKVVKMDLVRAQVFYPTRADIVQTHDFSCLLAPEIAAAFLCEFRDKKKATWQYLSSADGPLSPKNITDEYRESCRGKEATTNLSESTHACTTQSLKVSGMISLDRSVAEGQTRMNNDFGRGHEALVSGRKAKETIDRAELMGKYHKLPDELKQSIVAAAKAHGAEMHKRFNAGLKKQLDVKKEKEEIAAKHNLDKSREDHIVAYYFYHQYFSPRCWTTVEIAMVQFNALESEAQKVIATREQILIRKEGLGMIQAHKNWSENGRTFTSQELFKHLVEVVIPMQATFEIPDEPPISMPTLSNLPTLGTTSDLANNFKIASEEHIAELKAGRDEEIMRREERGEGDLYSEMQQFQMPKIETLQGYEIEMLFSYNHTDGTPYLDWAHGKVKKVLNAKYNRVQIEWSGECVNSKDNKVSNHVLAKRKYNGGLIDGAWRQYLANVS